QYSVAIGYGNTRPSFFKELHFCLNSIYIQFIYLGNTLAARMHEACIFIFHCQIFLVELDLIKKNRRQYIVLGETCPSTRGSGSKAMIRNWVTTATTWGPIHDTITAILAGQLELTNAISV
ncbi:unnamed protein product, partial [Owenia fusiformis]